MQYSTVQCEHLLDLGWQLPESSYDLRPALLQRDAVLAHHEAEHGQGQDLGRVRLGGDLVTVKTETWRTLMFPVSNNKRLRLT